jgi:hypothetical protein
MDLFRGARLRIDTKCRVMERLYVIFRAKKAFQLHNLGLLRETEPDSGVPLTCLKSPNSKILKKSTFENKIFDLLARGLIK